ncbi:MAG: RNA polymerase sigma factor [Clostridium sp.]|nr:RNA polymerase sigma factor [Clostridium sp.]
MQQDFLLVRKMQDGDEAAMDIFVQKYYPKILQYCGYHCPDRESAYDLTQETFAHFFKNLIHYRHREKALNYLYTIARNLCIDWGRKNKAIAYDRFTEIDGIAIADKISGADTLNGADGMNGADERVAVRAVLAKLPEELREAVILHYFQEYTLRETAQILHIGLPLVKYRIKRAKEQLRSLLGEI